MDEVGRGASPAVERNVLENLIMTPQRIAGIVLLVLGVVLLIFGLNSSNSVVDQVSEGVTGRYTDTTMWYIIGGIVLGLVGLVLTLMGAKRSLT